MRDRRIIKKWATHIINKFGKENAERFAYSNIRCPCIFLNKICGDCVYRKSLEAVCDASLRYDEFISNDLDCNPKRLREQLKRLKERLKGIKDLILKEI